MPEVLQGLLESLLDAVLDTAKLLPAVLLMYVIIEILEDFSLFKKANPLLRSKLAPVVGAGVALFPQCGFSVVGARLYSERKIKLGTLLAVFIATSDEAVPVLLAEPQAFNKLIVLLAVKFAAAVVFGIIINALIKTPIPIKDEKKEDITECECGCHGKEHADKGTGHYFKAYFLEPVKHTLKIGLFILIVNVALSVLIYFVSEERLQAFLNSALFLQPIVCLIVGLIPNCASSVVLASLLASNTISFGGALAGLIASSGVASIVLFKMNRPVKNTFFVLLLLSLIALIVGYATLFIKI